MEIQIDKLTLGQTIKALKKTSEGLTQLEVEYPDNYIIRKIMTMKHLVDRRVFRSFNPGENHCIECKSGTCDVHSVAESVLNTVKHGDEASAQIPFYERALYNRYYERDVEESIGGFEHDGMVRGYGADMMSLYCRIPDKQPCGIGKTLMPGGQHGLSGKPDWAFSS